MGSRLPPGNRMTALIGLEESPLETRARLLMEALAVPSLARGVTPRGGRIRAV